MAKSFELRSAASRSWLHKWMKRVEETHRVSMNLYSASTIAYRWMTNLLFLPEFSMRATNRFRERGARSWNLSDRVGGQLTPDGRGRTVTTDKGYLGATAYPRPCPEVLPPERLVTQTDVHTDSAVLKMLSVPSGRYLLFKNQLLVTADGKQFFVQAKTKIRYLF